jgi:uncharacterized membrane protein
LKCRFVFKDADSSVKGLLALVQMIIPGPICQTAGMVIVKESHQPVMQCTHDGSYSHKPLVAIGTTYIIPVIAIYGAVQNLLLTPQSDS